ncbi:MAG: prolyl oligopeptidase family serine peptidase [Planctomyces sp.]|nr:prolyl oligopeptidase family serine peptidase [Planctomyces sp.]
MMTTIRLLFFLLPAQFISTDSLTEAERQAIVAEMQPVQQQLDTLRNSPQVSPDRWADAQIFLKGVIWALDFGPVDDAKAHELVQKAIRRARERTELLADGQQPWTTKRGMTIRGFISEIDGSVQPYGLIVPAGYDPSKPTRLDVVLHGSRSATGLGELQFIDTYDAGDTGDTSPNGVNFIEVHPMGRLGENAYRFEGETDVDEAIEAVCRDYRIDRARIVLRGSSLGGVGAWQLGLKRPGRYVAIGPAAGPVDTIEFANSPWKHFVRLDPLTDWQKATLHLVDAIDYTGNARMVPVVAAMGDQDPYFSSHQLIEKAFEKEGVPFVGLIDHGAGHSITPRVYQEQLRLLGEHAAKGIDPFPKHLHFVTWTLKFSRCHWLEVLGLEAHYQRADLEATVDVGGAIHMAEPRNVTRFALHPPAVSANGGQVIVGQTKLTLPPQPTDAVQSVFIEKLNGTWSYQGLLNETRLTGKRPGLQGPLDDAFARPFLCVRGTGQAWNPEIDAWAEANLQRFSYEWRRHYRGYLPVKNDTEVTEDDVRRFNLILFGDPGSNRWINEILPQLPITWTEDTLQIGSIQYSAAQHGVQLIHPNPLPGASGRYVVLNSGHTWHDAELRFSYMVFPRLGDWAVFRVGNNSSSDASNHVAETVLTSGFFDEQWQVREQPE